MPRQKKIVPYVLNLKLPRDGHEWLLLWKNRANYTLDDMLAMGERAATVQGTINQYEGGYREYHLTRLRAYDVGPEHPDAWRAETDGCPSLHTVRRIIRHAWTVSPERAELNRMFFEEYNSREDLQNLYRDHYGKMYQIRDEFGNTWVTQEKYAYDRSEEAREKRLAYIEANRHAPSCFEVYLWVATSTPARRFIENNRVTPYEIGDLVRLRDPYVGHYDYDPMYVSRYEQMHEGKTLPPVEVPRIGIVFNIDKDGNYRGTRGSKMIEVQWNGKESTTHIAENKLKWLERPTKKNGMKT